MTIAVRDMRFVDSPTGYRLWVGWAHQTHNNFFKDQCNELSSPLTFQAVGELRCATQKRILPYLETVFGSSVLGYYRNMAVQHGSFRGRGPATYVDINRSF